MHMFVTRGWDGRTVTQPSLTVCIVAIHFISKNSYLYINNIAVVLAI